MPISTKKTPFFFLYRTGTTTKKHKVDFPSVRFGSSDQDSFQSQSASPDRILPAKNAQKISKQEIENLINVNSANLPIPKEIKEGLIKAITNKLKEITQKGFVIPDNKIKAIITSIVGSSVISLNALSDDPSNGKPLTTTGNNAQQTVSVSEFERWGNAILCDGLNDWHWKEALQIVESSMVNHVTLVAKTIGFVPKNEQERIDFLKKSFKNLRIDILPKGLTWHIEDKTFDSIYSQWNKIAETEANRNGRWPNWERRKQILDELVREAITLTP